MKSSTRRNSSYQLTGAFGEKAVEAELLRREWLAANVNASVENARAYDIFAWKNGRNINVRVMTCSGGGRWGAGDGFIDQSLVTIQKNDFIVFVNMGDEEKRNDCFYVMPTERAIKDFKNWRDNDRSKLKKNGQEKVHPGKYRLQLAGDPLKGNQGFAVKWGDFLGNWKILETPTNCRKRRLQAGSPPMPRARLRR